MATNKHAKAIMATVRHKEKNSAKALAEELEKQFRELAVESEQELVAVAKDAERRMRVTVWRDADGERSPDSKKYGPIAKTISVNKGRDSRGFHVDFAVGAFYSSFQEYGTVHQPPRPRFRPAVAQAIAEYQAKR